jgi:hypothetical protein
MVTRTRLGVMLYAQCPYFLINVAVCQLHNFATIFFQGELHTPEKILEDIDIDFEATIDQRMCNGHK